MTLYNCLLCLCIISNHLGDSFSIFHIILEYINHNAYRTSKFLAASLFSLYKQQIEPNSSQKLRLRRLFKRNAQDYQRSRLRFQQGFKIETSQHPGRSSIEKLYYFSNIAQKWKLNGKPIVVENATPGEPSQNLQFNIMQSPLLLRPIHTNPYSNNAKSNLLKRDNSKTGVSFAGLQEVSPGRNESGSPMSAIDKDKVKTLFEQWLFAKKKKQPRQLMKLHEVIEILKDEKEHKMSQRSPKLYKGSAKSLIQNRYNAQTSRNGSSLTMPLNKISHTSRENQIEELNETQESRMFEQFSSQNMEGGNSHLEAAKNKQELKFILQLTVHQYRASLKFAKEYLQGIASKSNLDRASYRSQKPKRDSKIYLNSSEVKFADSSFPYYIDSQPMTSPQVQEKMNQDLYSKIQTNKACVLPDPKVKSADGLPSFLIYTNSAIGGKNSANLQRPSIIQKRKRFRSDLKTNQEAAQTTFGEMMEEIIQPQVQSLMMKNPNLTQSESIMMEKSQINAGTVKVSQILKKQKDPKERREAFRIDAKGSFSVEGPRASVDYQQMKGALKLALSKRLLENSIKIDNRRLELTNRTVYDVIGEQKYPEPTYKSDQLALKLHDHYTQEGSSQASPGGNVELIYTSAKTLNEAEHNLMGALKKKITSIFFADAHEGSEKGKVLERRHASKGKKKILYD